MPTRPTPYALATYSLLPIVQAFTKGTGVEVETRDISVAGRIIANFPDRLKPEQRLPDPAEHRLLLLPLRRPAPGRRHRGVE